MPALVDTIRRAGVEVGLVLEGIEAASAAGPGVQIAAFRIVQEALSNAVRHAPGARVTVRLHADAGSLHIRVRNAAPPQPVENPTGGYGLRGMRERAELLGGSLAAGPSDDGGWTVDATLPLSPAASAAAPTAPAEDKENS